MDQPPSATAMTHRSALVTWPFARNMTKPYIPAGLDPAQHPLKKVCAAAQSLKQTKSKPYSVLGYCDDITMLSSTSATHQAALSGVETNALTVTCRSVQTSVHRTQLMARRPTTASASIFNKDQLTISPLP